MRLDKYISEALGVTRSESRALIARRAVTVNDVAVKKSDFALKGDETVCVSGSPVSRQEFVYIMLNKPEGVVSASRDKKDTTVTDLVSADFPRRELFPAGRLDKSSTGFVLITDDGAFAHDILSPRHHVSKTYQVTLDTPCTPLMVQGFADGVTLADGQTLAPAGLTPDDTDPSRVTVLLHQGVYHQIKRMFGVYDAGVNSLHRSAIGPVQLDKTLAPGHWRLLTPAEVEAIRACVGPTL